MEHNAYRAVLFIICVSTIVISVNTAFATPTMTFTPSGTWYTRTPTPTVTLTPTLTITGSPGPLRVQSTLPSLLVLCPTSTEAAGFWGQRYRPGIEGVDTGPATGCEQCAFRTQYCHLERFQGSRDYHSLPAAGFVRQGITGAAAGLNGVAPIAARVSDRAALNVATEYTELTKKR